MNGGDEGIPTVGKVHLLSKIANNVGLPAQNGAVRIMREFGFPTLFALLAFSLVVWYAKGTREDLRAEREDGKAERAAFIEALHKNTAAIESNGERLSDIKTLLEGHTGLKALGVKLLAKPKRP